MKMRFFVVFWILLTAVPFVGSAQYFVQGVDPGSFRWRQIKTPNFQVIYPVQDEQIGMRMAAILDEVYLYASKTLHQQPRKISVLLHTANTRSNGFAAWAPARVELFTTPDQDIYAQDWLQQLAIHEFRHVVQISKIGQSLPGIFKALLGEQAAAVVIGAYLPFWFLEGDAVVTETSLSHSGRGRVPSFSMQLRAQAVEKGFFSYDKAYLGSYRDYVPDYYQLGYQMVAGVRDRFGADVWSDVLNHVARQPLSLNSFSKGLKKSTGQSHIDLYHSIFTDLTAKWKEEDKSLQPDVAIHLTAKPKKYTSYTYPSVLPGGEIFALKTGINDIPRFVTITPNQGEKVVFTPGKVFGESVACQDYQAVWVETQSDIRWTNRDFALLRILNLSTGKLVQHRLKEKIFAPCFSPDGLQLAAIKTKDDNTSSILLLSAQTGKIQREIPLAKDLMLFTPTWAKTGYFLYAVALSRTGKSLVTVDLKSGAIKTLLPADYQEIGRPTEGDGFLYFTISTTGKDEIYRLKLDSSLTKISSGAEQVNSIDAKSTSGHSNSDIRLDRVSESRFGVRDVKVFDSGKSLIYCNYTADGYQLVKRSIADLEIRQSLPKESAMFALANRLTAQETGIPTFSTTDSVKYASKRYSKIGHLFNFHSWSPLYVDSENEDIRPGVSIMSQNKLSTAIAEVGYDYSTTDQTGKWRAKFNYSGCFPVFKLSTDYGRQNSQYYKITRYTNSSGQTIRVDTSLVKFNYSLLNFNATVNIPFDLSRGKTSRIVQPEVQLGYSKIFLDNTTPTQLFHGSVIPLTYRLYANQYRLMGIRDLQPVIGQIVDLNFRHSPMGDRDYGRLWSAEGTLFFPGFAPHHGIRIYGGYQNRSFAQSYFGDIIDYPRGCRSLLTTELGTLRTDYVLPLFYPDLSIGGLGYVKRFALRIFYDQAWSMVPVEKLTNLVPYHFGSTGGELSTDINILRLYFPIKAAIRTSYQTVTHETRYEFLLQVNFGG